MEDTPNAPRGRGRGLRRNVLPQRPAMNLIENRNIGMASATAAMNQLGLGEVPVGPPLSSERVVIPTRYAYLDPPGDHEGGATGGEAPPPDPDQESPAAAGKNEDELKIKDLEAKLKAEREENEVLWRILQRQRELLRHKEIIIAQLKNQRRGTAIFAAEMRRERNAFGAMLLRRFGGGDYHGEYRRRAPEPEEVFDDGASCASNVAVMGSDIESTDEDENRRGVEPPPPVEFEESISDISEEDPDHQKG